MSQRLTLRQRNRLLTMRLVQSTAMDMFERDGYGYVLSSVDVKNVVVRLAVDVGNDLVFLTLNY